MATRQAQPLLDYYRRFIGWRTFGAISDSHALIQINPLILLGIAQAKFRALPERPRKSAADPEF
jgi:hypothetical protein